MQFHCFYGVINLKMRSKHADSLFLWCNKFEIEKKTCRILVSMVL